MKTTFKKIVVFLGKAIRNIQYIRQAVVLFLAIIMLTSISLIAFAVTTSINTVHFEAESGIKTGALITVADTSASNGSAVKFGGTSSVSYLNYPRIAWEGGSNYWSQYAKANAAGWTNTSFFPITVFYGKADPTHVASLKDAGINVIGPVEHDPTTLPLTNITDAGLYALPGVTEWTPAEVGNNPKAVGWFISDECDMGLGGCENILSGQQASNYQLQQQTTWVNQSKSYNDGRFAMANFGNGILRTYWSDYPAPAPWSPITSPTAMYAHVQLMDVSSADKYTYTSPDVAGITVDSPDWTSGAPVARAYSYGWQADQMRRYQDPGHLRPVWTFVETAKPFLTEAGANTIQPDQIEGAVWSAIIHEARGISYFDHNNNGVCGTYSIVECTNVHAKVKSINIQVTALAPVINTQSYYNTQTTLNSYTYNKFSFNNNSDTMLKTYNGYAYIFAGIGIQQSPGDKTFTLPTGVNGTTVEVVGESRTLTVTNRAFTDNFAAEYSHHVYKISL